MKKIFLVIITILMMNISNATGVKMEGSVDCGMWVEGRKSKRSQLLEAYVMGKVDGLAEGAWIDIWRSNERNISRDQLYLWLDQYCNKKPLDSMLNGIWEFSNEVTGDEYKKKHEKIRRIK